MLLRIGRRSAGPLARMALSAVPLLVFWMLSTISGPETSILGGFAAYLVVFRLTQGARNLQALSALSLAIVSMSAMLGVVTSSEKAYLAAGPASDFVVAPVFLGSIAANRPLVAGVVHEAAPGIAAILRRDAAVFVWLTAGWGLFNLVTGFIRTYMLAEMSTTEYMIWSRVIGWPLGWTVIAAMGAVLLFAARRASHRHSVSPA
ncbi:MAG: hypothetical protein Kow0010_19730 [Dehalococcoidia bacterium]